MTTTVINTSAFDTALESLSSLIDSQWSHTAVTHIQFNRMQRESNRIRVERENRSCAAYDMEDLVDDDSSSGDGSSGNLSVPASSTASLTVDTEKPSAPAITPKTPTAKTPTTTKTPPKSKTPPKLGATKARSRSVAKKEEKAPEVKINIEKGKLELSDEVRFAPNSANVSNKSSALLNEVCKVIREHRVKIRVEGHTSQGKNESKLVKLSQERAQSVMQVLIKKGIPSKYLESEGYGSARPPEDANASAKRVEFVVVGEI